MDEGTAGNTRGQLVGGGVWVQVAEIFRPDRKFKSEKSEEKNRTHAAHEWCIQNRSGE